METVPRINKLDSETASLIAAGEVIERPASVVKELVENSLDAGAHEIIIEVTKGGLELIRVKDDGYGIQREDVPLAFARHATSKIKGPEDLNEISTLGFRGEALPSIMSVAKVEMLTRTWEEPVGTLLVAEGGNLLKVAEAGCPPGTQVTVRDLFYNIPARKKFLKSPASEGRAVATLVERLALAHPQVKFTLYMDGRRVLYTPGRGELREALASLYGVEVAQALLPVSAEEGEWGLTGLISPPWLHRSSRSLQVLAINGRLVFHRGLVRAVEESYRSLIPEGRYPLFVLHLRLDPRRVDVNVHPTKLEVKLEGEQEWIARIMATINKSLHSSQGIAPALRKREKTNPGAILRQKEFFFTCRSTEPEVWGEYLLKRAKDDPPWQLQEPSLEEKRSPLPQMRILGQIKNSYIVAEGEDGLYLIDQHAAHERCRFFHLKKALEEQGSWPSQVLSPPTSLQLTPSLAQALGEALEILASLGFLLEPFGDNSFLIRGVPVGLPPGKEKSVLMEFLETGERADQERLLKLLACHGAIKAGDPLSLEEMAGLLREMQQWGLLPYTCPHGRPVVVRWDWPTIAALFQRTGGDR